MQPVRVCVAPVSASLNRQQCPHLLTPHRCLKGGRVKERQRQEGRKEECFLVPPGEQKLTCCRLRKKRLHKFTSLSLPFFAGFDFDSE